MSAENKLIIGPATSDTIEDDCIFIEYDGTVVTCGDMYAHTILIENLGPLKRVAGKLYPVVYDQNQFPLADTTQVPVKYFAEFCTRCPFHGFLHFDYIRPKQLASLKTLLQRHNLPVELTIHPQPELVNLLEKSRLTYNFK